MTRKLVALLPIVVLLLAPAGAGAHISIHPNAVPAGAFATLDVRVPGEQAGAHVTRVDMLMPPGFIGVDYAPVPGWDVRVVESKLATPLEQDGEKVETEVSQIIWSWTGPLGQVGNGAFVDFPLSVAMPDSAGRSLQFKTIQSYSNGKKARWIEPGLEDEFPSPRINVTAKGGVLQDVAGEEAGPPAGLRGAASAPTPLPAAAGGTPRASRALAIAALIVGALGLLAGLTGLLAAGSARRGGRGGED
jgi:uncharacterized protein YcnI